MQVAWAAVAAALAVVGCGGRTQIDVVCVNEKDGLRCTVEHQQGSDVAKACWEVTFRCKNGTEGRGSACQVVEPGKKAVARIPKAQIQGAEKCDLITESGVDKLRVERPD